MAVGLVYRQAYGLGLNLAHLIACNALVDANVICVRAIDAQRAVRLDLHMWRLLRTDLVGVVHPDDVGLGLASCLAGPVQIIAADELRILGHVREARCSCRRNVKSV